MCMYQPFLDGWKFTPDVGNGSSRGEVFTPRYVVDKMIVDSKIMPRKAVYDFDYSGAQNTLRKYVGHRVFEPAVGTGNFSASILWHKLEMANELTGYSRRARRRSRKSEAQLRRYRAYTLVALGSIYFNDIDPGNLQTTIWRLLREREIGSPDNIDAWVNHINSHLRSPLPDRRVRSFVAKSIREASDNWGVGDRDSGVLNVLYERHTGEEAPGWLTAAWKLVLGENAKLFDAISEEDRIERSSVVPGFHAVEWTFWSFDNSRNHLRANRTRIPFVRQVLSAEIDFLRAEIDSIPMTLGNALDLFTGEAQMTPDGPEARTEHRRLSGELDKRLDVLSRTPMAHAVESIEMLPAH